MKPACVQMITESKRLTSIGLTDCLGPRVHAAVCTHACKLTTFTHKRVRRESVCVSVCLADSGSLAE